MMETTFPDIRFDMEAVIAIHQCGEQINNIKPEGGESDMVRVILHGSYD
jgi:hypothetical protein